MDVQAFHDRFADRHAWVEGGIRVLENDLHIAARHLELARCHRKDIPAFELDRPSGRLDQPQHRPSYGSLAATRFTDQAKGFAFSHKETDIIHSLYLIDNPLQQTCPHRKIFHQVVDLYQNVPLMIVICLHVECSNAACLINRLTFVRVGRLKFQLKVKQIRRHSVKSPD